jgi:ribonuclease PH
MPRTDGRGNLDLRPVRIERGFMKYAEGSCLISMGETKVICTASVEDRVPMWLKGQGQGWVTAEYAMLPRSGRDRKPREGAKPDGRSIEIQRLIGRSLRAVVDLKALGERVITLDCDVLSADGGTRCASITGCYVALVEAIATLKLKKSPLLDSIAAVSCGVYQGVEILDLCYEEDSRAMVDMDIVATGGGKYVEVRGTAEGKPYDRKQMDRLLDTANVGLEVLFRKQKEALDGLL